MAKLLETVPHHWGLQTHQQLLAKVIKDGLFPPPSTELAPRVAMNITAWATYQQIPVRSSYTLSPPSDVACLVSRPIIRQIVMALPPSLQMSLKGIPEQHPHVSAKVTPRLRIFDSHIHCDALLRRLREDNWGVVVTAAETDTLSFTHMIYSCNFPHYWAAAETILEDS